MLKISSLFQQTKIINLVAETARVCKVLFYVAVPLFVIFVCLSNSITHLAKSIWSDVGNNWDVVWAFISTRIFTSSLSLFMLGTMGIHMIVYWSLSGLMALVDMYEPSFLTRYKMQPFKNTPFDRERFWDACHVAVKNQFVVGLPLLCVCYPIFMARGISMTVPLPNFYWFLTEMGVFIVVEEILFYYTHRLLHSKAFYGRFHKMHHEFVTPIAISAVYCHPVEHLICNLIPAFIGPLIMGSHLAVIWVWQIMATFNAVNTHCGYHFPFFPSPESHDFHHLKFTECYGVLGFLDYLHGTDVSFRKSLQFKRHSTHFNLTDFNEITQEALEFTTTTSTTNNNNNGVASALASLASSKLGTSSLPSSSNSSSKRKSISNGDMNGGRRSRVGQ